jgi:magnesium transporter
MTTQFAKVRENATVRDALNEIAHQSEELETIYYIYVVDEDNHLQGLVSARRPASLSRPWANPIR